VSQFGDRSKTPYHTSNRSHTGTPESIACQYAVATNLLFVWLYAKENQARVL
jgi:hypothetical protein